MIDEGPSPEDLERFGDDTGYCPSCGAEIWDAAPACPECGESIPDGPDRRPPLESHLNRKMMLLVIILVLIAFVIVFVL